MSKRVNSSGAPAFTLIELIAVISLIAIIGAVMTGATMTYLTQMRSRAAAARICNDVRYAQRTALASRLRSWVVFDIPGNSYRVYLENAANPGKANRQPLSLPFEQSTAGVQLGTAPLTGVILQSVGINGTSEIEFDSFGAPYDGNAAVLSANGVIVLTEGVSVTIRPLTGFVDRAG